MVIVEDEKRSENMSAFITPRDIADAGLTLRE